MKSNATSAIVVVACILVGGAIAVTQFLAPKNAADPELEAGLRSDIGRLRQDIADQNETIARLRNDVIELRARPVAPPSTLDESAVRRLVAEALASGELERPAAAAGAAKEEAEGEVAFDLARTLEDMVAGDFDWDARQKFWAKIKEQGKYKEAVAWFKERAKNMANDPDAQADFADACNALIQSGTIGYAEMGPLSMAADAAYDKALGLDDHHWRSRFSKAISYSFWPDAMGKKPEAIRHFEILAQQQGEVAPRPEHAQTHLFLGNLYAQQGKMDEARANWQRGLEIDPKNEMLKNQLAGAGAGGK